MSELDRMMEQTRVGLVNKRQEIEDKIKELQGMFKEIERELSAIDAYERTRQGRSIKLQRNTGRRKAVIELLLKNAMSRQEILIALDAKGDKSAEQSISNTLSMLKKAGKVSLKNGIYSALT